MQRKQSGIQLTFANGLYYTLLGGRAVLAHPPTLGSSWAARFVPQCVLFRRFTFFSGPAALSISNRTPPVPLHRVPELALNGLWGIEAFSSEIDQENHDIIAKVARENNLVMTGGSDNHGSLKVGTLHIRAIQSQVRPLVLMLPFPAFACLRSTQSWARCIVRAPTSTKSWSTGRAKD